MSGNRKLAAILVADIVGFSRMAQVDEDQTLAHIRALQSEVIGPTVAAHNGRVVKRTGDGALVEFQSVVEAACCAIEIQETQNERNSGVARDQCIELRIGIHLGDVVEEEDGDLMGDGVNIAARLEGLAPPGAICLSEDAYRQVRSRLDHDVMDLGEKVLKNIAEPLRVYAVAIGTPVKLDPSLAVPQGTSSEDKPSIAVLPFSNMSGDAEQEYFSDGISEDIITALSRFRSFQVTARNSTFGYKGQSVDIKKVGEELGVRYVLEGSVRKAGNRVRITAQLIEADTANQLWADRFDRELVDIFDLQDEITESIVGAIEQQVGSIERMRAAHQRPEDLKSWDLFQRGMFYVWQMTGDSLATGTDLLRQSLERDPTFAEAHGWLAFAYLHQVYMNTVENTEETVTAAHEHTRQAILHDDHLSLGHEMYARVLIFERRYDEAVAAGTRAVQLNPNSSSANFSLGVVLIFADRCEEALEPTERAMQLSPKDHRRHNHLNSMGIILSETGHLPKGVEVLREAVSLQHGDYRSALWLARYAAEAGFKDEAKRAAQIVMRLNPEFTLSRVPTTFGAFFHPDYLERFMPHIIPLGFPE